MRYKLLIPTAALLFAAAAPPAFAKGTPHDASPPDARIFALNAQGAAAPLSFDQLVAELTADGVDVVVVGEYHDDPASHRMELALLAACAGRKLPELAERGGMNWASAYIDRRFALSMEMFERDVQAVVDNYVSGNPHSPMPERDFMRASRPWGNYSTDYRPLVEFCRRHRLQVIAANPPTELARRVAREGILATHASLDDSQREWIAQETSAPDDGYWQRFFTIMGGGDTTHGGMDEAKIRQFYASQCLKDDTMAESILGYLGFYKHRMGCLCNACPDEGAFVFHVNGSFHSDYGHGVPQRLLQREQQLGVRTVALRPVPDFAHAAASGALSPHSETLPDGTPVADYVVFVPAP